MSFSSDNQRKAAFANMNAGRTQGAINRDLSLRASETPPFTPENVKLWAQNPRRIDIEGVDTPIDRRLPVRKAKSAHDYNEEPNPEKMTYGDLTEISKGNFYGKSVDPKTSKDADKLLKAIQNGDYETLSNLRGKHHLTRKRARMKGLSDVQARAAEITIHDLADRAIRELTEIQNSAPSAPNETTFTPDDSLLNKELLRNAHAGTSFDPEKRAETEKEYFKAEVNSVYNELKGSAETDKQKAELKDEIIKFQKKYAEKYNDLLATRGRMLSPMITGPANFPTRRNDKAYSSYENKRQANATFRNKVVSSIKKRWRKENIEAAGGEKAILEKKLAGLEKSHQQMKDINVIMRKKVPDDDKREQLKKAGISDTLIRDVFKPDYLGRTRFQGFHLQNSNAKIKNAKERLTTMEKRESTETTSKSINGVKVVDNTEDNRVQLFFDGKPDDTMRDRLKGSGWRWAPSVGAWQRKRTDAAIQSAKQILSTQADRCEPPHECDELRLTQKLQDME